MKPSLLALVLLLLAAVVPLPQADPDTALLQRRDAPERGIWVDSLDVSRAPIRRPRGQRGSTAPPPPLTFALGGVTYAHALPLASDGDIAIDLGGAATRFLSMVGIDDSVTSGGSVVFGVWVDGKKVAETPVMHGGDAPRMISADLAGAKRLVLATIDANDGPASDTAEWGGALIVMAPGRQDQPRIVVPDEPPPSIASSRSDVPMINYPRITGATPRRPFLFRIPASGKPPLTFAARNLPAGLTLDPQSGIITGALKQAGRTDVDVTVKGATGESRAVITIVGGPDALALTPPLGWNSWNVWAAQVDAAKVRAAADAMVSTGLAAQGYTYINIDDAWEGPRTANGEITSNEKFPDMKALTDYVHARGLKVGIYSSPGPRTCQQRFAGSYQHEAQDARTWATWGFDYIKYDWCSYSDVEPAREKTPLPGLMKPYMLMRGILDKLDRDVVFSLCQYGWGNVWEWGDEAGGNLWRVTGDITDTWPSMSGIGFQQTGHEKYAGPGHWNDTDMLVVGLVGWGRGPAPRPTNLTPDEQLTHISLWALQAAPLLIGADLSQADDFTIDLLGNREVLAVNQDPSGKAAGRIASDTWTEVWARQLSDGTLAVGLFNRAPVPMPVSVKFADIGLADNQPVRFLWTQKDLANPAGSTYETTVPRHGVVFVKIGRPQKRTTPPK
jgi:alpha-galactosidase